MKFTRRFGKQEMDLHLPRDAYFAWNPNLSILSTLSYDVYLQPVSVVTYIPGTTWVLADVEWTVIKGENNKIAYYIANKKIRIDLLYEPFSRKEQFQVSCLSFKFSYFFPVYVNILFLSAGWIWIYHEIIFSRTKFAKKKRNEKRNFSLFCLFSWQERWGRDHSQSSIWNSIIKFESRTSRELMTIDIGIYLFSSDLQMQFLGILRIMLFCVLIDSLSSIRNIYPIRVLLNLCHSRNFRDNTSHFKVWACKNSRLRSRENVGSVIRGA